MSTTTDQWAKPHEVSDLDMAFGAHALELMPPRDVCKAGLAELPDKGRGWIDFQETWFFRGLNPKVKFHMRDGIDGDAALRHLKAIQGSFAPKHEHKMEAVAYLASRWFSKVKNYKPA